jgi:hypothetical protein
MPFEIWKPNNNGRLQKVGAAKEGALNAQALLTIEKK